MRYLITTNDGSQPFLSDWFDAENNFKEGIRMIVYDLYKNQYTTNGKIWQDIKVDHL